MKLIYIFLLISLFACGRSTKDKGGFGFTGDGAVMEMAEEAAYNDNISTKSQRVASSSSQHPQQNIVITERKLIKEGDISFQVKDLSEGGKRIKEAVKKYDAYLSSDQSYKSSYQVTHTFVIRVPAENFDKLLATITAGVDKIDNKNIRVKDVTEEFLDVQARLETKKQLEKRYLKLLEKANTVKDILAIEQQIGNLRAEIESIEGRLRYLVNQVSLSTLTISIYEKLPQQGISFSDEFKEAFESGWYNLIWFFVGLVNMWAFILLIGLLGYLFYTWRKKKKKNKEKVA